MASKREDLEALRSELEAVIDAARAFEAQHEDSIEALPARHRASARNLVHYVSARHTDLRPLQAALADLGLSSLGRMECAVMDTLGAVTQALDALRQGDAAIPQTPGVSEGAHRLAERAVELFGPAPEGRSVRIMVTMPAEAGSDPALVERLVAAGMDVMRINCAHDDSDTWLRMVEHGRAAASRLGRELRISADLAGPKIRTGALAEQVRVRRYRPERGVRGEVVHPARVRLVAHDTGAADALPLEPALLERLRAGDRLQITDARGRRRKTTVEADDAGLFVQLDRTTWAETGCRILVRRRGEFLAESVAGDLPAADVPLRLGRGDHLWLTRDQSPGGPGDPGGDGPRIACVPAAAIERVEVGQPVWFDDGRLGGRVDRVEPGRVRVLITQAAPGGSNLRSEKGINLPESTIPLPSFSDADLDALRIMAPHVDLVGASFVRSEDDVRELNAHLDAAGRDGCGIMLKIETRAGFSALPAMLLEGLAGRPLGVMVARGDLAVEVGFERLAEVQEEILWLAEAAHVPVVWATQVLDTMARTGMPSRAEVTDAAMSERAECVMLNKGPHVVEAVAFLDGVLRRMQAHQYKKRAMLRRLSVDLPEHPAWPPESG